MLFLNSCIQKTECPGNKLSNAHKVQQAVSDSALDFVFQIFGLKYGD